MLASGGAPGGVGQKRRQFSETYDTESETEDEERAYLRKSREKSWRFGSYSSSGNGFQRRICTGEEGERLRGSAAPNPN